MYKLALEISGMNSTLLNIVNLILIEKKKDKRKILFINPYNLYMFIYLLIDSGEIFDPSCPDITGHILEGLSKSGYTI